MFCSYQSNAFTRCAVPASAAVLPFGNQLTLTLVPAVVVPSACDVYLPTAHASMYGGASEVIAGGYTAVEPEGMPSSASENCSPSAGCE